MLKQFTILSFVFTFLLSCNAKNTKETDLTNNSVEYMDKVVDEISDDEIFLIVGTYTHKESNGIYVFSFDTITGASRLIGEAEVSNPSYLDISKNKKFIYTISENKGKDALLTAFAFDKEKGALHKINSELTGGDAPCYVSITNDGQNLVTANYSGESITVFSIDDNGALNTASQILNFTGKGIDEKRQSKPHLHCVKFSSDNRFLFATDLGTDKIYKFKVDQSTDKILTIGEPAAYKLKGETGPRHLTFHPNNKYAYLIGELSGEVVTFEYNSDEGNLKEIQYIKADTLNARGSADIHISPDGKFLYASNRLKGDGLAIFSINQSNGMLTKIGYQVTGLHPRNFVITPNGEYLLVANRDSDNIQVFDVDKNTGLLTDTRQDIEISMPVCLKFIE